MYGDYLLNAQGEDVVAGIRNTDPIVKMGENLPEAYKQFMEITAKLEKHYRDMQDVEFTIERGRLWMLQTRNGKRTAAAAVKIAVDMANEGLITREEAVMRVTPKQVDALLHPQFDEDGKKDCQERRPLLRHRRECLPGRRCWPDLLRRRHRREDGQRRKAGCDHGPPVHQAG